MRLGFGLYKSLLTPSNFQFAKQAGATHLVIQLVDYIGGSDQPDLMRDYLDGWGVTDNEHIPWSYDLLSGIQQEVRSHGLEWEAIENLDPAHWYDVLLDGAKKDVQLEQLKQLLRAMGKLGIPILGYYFSLAGVWGWLGEASGRGGAKSIVFDASKIPAQQPIEKGMVWNMEYQKRTPGEVHPPVSREEIWQRYRYFLDHVLPIAEEEGVRMVAHPDDPPMSPLRETARLFTTITNYEKLAELYPSAAHGFECCLGTIQEMKESEKDVYQFVDEQSRAGEIGYVHFRNVVGKVPRYREAFVDEGDIDMPRIVKILAANKYDGLLIPDHTPEMSCGAPWHAGMAFAMGYMRALLQTTTA